MPKNVSDCRFNFNLALSVANIDKNLTEELVVGTKLFTVLDAIKNKQKIRYVDKNSILPYSQEEK